MSFNGKIRIRRGAKGRAKSFSVVENYRRKDNGRPTNRTVLYIGTLGYNEWINANCCRKFWEIVEWKIDVAVSRKIIPDGDAIKVKDKLRSALGISVSTLNSSEMWNKIKTKHSALFDD